MKRFVVYLLPIVVWAGTIFILSSQSRLPSVEVDHFDKVMHFGAYGGLGLLFARAFAGYGARPNPALVLGLFFASAYGATDELHQLYTPGRSPSWADWIADTLGAVTGALFWVKLIAPRLTAVAERTPS